MVDTISAQGRHSSRTHRCRLATSFFKFGGTSELREVRLACTKRALRFLQRDHRTTRFADGQEARNENCHASTRNSQGDVQMYPIEHGQVACQLEQRKVGRGKLNHLRQNA